MGQAPYWRWYSDHFRCTTSITFFTTTMPCPIFIVSYFKIYITSETKTDPFSKIILYSRFFSIGKHFACKSTWQRFSLLDTNRYDMITEENISLISNPKNINEKILLLKKIAEERNIGPFLTIDSFKIELKIHRKDDKRISNENKL
ncbi:hypothetical protein BpHYR1_037636 [Brachionus plicatilis]|uniref:Uncharacterized protein n=1 Tax=Brachionus plicatilis TaxID=10195 RepID=A0A3M7PAE5_BRAPC|nr:hypothetical protein BpHYR1_037636 [Brachionus plicatilis]